VLFAARGPGEELRVGISVSKRVGGAVVRNRIKRRLREIVRSEAAGLQPGWDLMIVARQESATASFDELSGAIARLLERAKLQKVAPCNASSKE
jgi:ribonuclease P protein component